MPVKDPKIYLNHILESILAIREYVSKLTEEEFFEDTEKQDAVIRRFEVIGEAIKNVSSDVRSGDLDIPWKKMAGFRDVLIHQYFNVNLAQVWDTIQKDLDGLEFAVKKLLNLL
ncbi:MAG: hypothetical protein G01um101416_735 [Microgenomates group bacterium Gr01-1014_16]|nr:MAG: hypothetical protein G01um101416_735 [Microgenomates group bacterium Gr01-1014_16]